MRYDRRILHLEGNVMKKFFSRAKQTADPFALAALLALLLVGCFESPLEPIAPSFDTQLSAPLFNKTWTVLDFQKKDTATTKLNPVDSTFYIDRMQYPSPVQVDTLKVTPSISSVYDTLGIFSVGTFSKSNSIDAAGFGISTAGDTVPPGSFSASPIQINDTAQYDYASIISGYLILTVRNNLQAPIQFPSGVVLKNDWTNPVDNAVVARFQNLGTIPAGQVAAESVFVSGQMLRGFLITDPINIQTTAASPFTSADSVVFNFSSSTLMSDNAFAVIPEQSIPSHNDTAYELDRNTKIVDAVFDRGTLDISVTTTLDVDTKIRLEIPELSGANIPYEDTFTEFRPILSSSIDLAGSHLTPQNTSAPTGTYLQYKVGITVISSNGVKKFVQRHDYVHASLRPGRTIVARYITGNIEQQYVNMNSGSKPEYGLGDADKITATLVLGGMRLTMRLNQPGSGFPYDFTGTTLVAKNSKTRTNFSLRIANGFIDPEQPGLQTLDFSTQPGFASFRDSITKSFPYLPDSFYVRGQVVVNPGFPDNNITRTIWDTTKVYPVIDMNIPSIIGIAAGRVDENYEIGDIADSATIASIIDGKMNLDCINHIPLKIIAKLNFLKWDEAHRQMVTLPVDIPPDTIYSAKYDTSSTRSSDNPSKFSISLTGSDMDQINQADSVNVRLDLQTTDASGRIIPVKIRTSDYIQIRGSATARIIVNK
jgi:hypothetical protein